MAKIALISPWNAICGVAEVAYFLVDALEKEGNQFTIFANHFAGEYYKVPEHIREDSPNVHRIFQTGFEADRFKRAYFDVATFNKLFIDNQCDVLIVNYQDYLYPSKDALNECMHFAKRNKAKVLVLYHDSFISPELEQLLINWGIFPPSVTQYCGAQVKIIDQGIPELKGVDCFDVLGESCAFKYKATWSLSCFGLGRNKTHDLVSLVKEINQENILSKPLSLSINISKPNQFDEYRYVEENRNFNVIKGYRQPHVLASDLNISDACVIWYPQLQGQSTSSAFRFAIGSRVPIICNRSNWVYDQEGNGCWIEVEEDDKNAFKRAITKLFRGEKPYIMAREQMDRLQQKKISQSGWSVVAKQYQSLF